MLRADAIWLAVVDRSSTEIKLENVDSKQNSVVGAKVEAWRVKFDV